MRALARALGVSPSTIHRWRTVGLTPKGRELLHEAGLKPKPRRPKKGAAGPVLGATYQVQAFVEKLEKKSEASKKGWAKRRRKDRYQALIHEYNALEPYHQNISVPKRFTEVAKGLTLSLEEAKGFWKAGAEGSLPSFLGVTASDIEKWAKTELPETRAQLIDNIRSSADAQSDNLYAEWVDIHAEAGIQDNPKDKDRIQVLRNHIKNNSDEFKRFMRAAEDLSFSTREAKDFWFSPSAL
jgi:hypothetical protein